VLKALKEAKRESEGKITYTPQPRIRLHTQTKRIPDFRLVVEEPMRKQHILIECQDRKRSDDGILDKMFFIRNNHISKTFFFVYPKQIDAEFSRKLERAGVQCFNLEELRAHLRDLAIAVRHTSRILGVSQAHSDSIHPGGQLAEQRRQVAYYSHPDAEFQLKDLLENQAAGPKNEARNNQMRTAFG
jgi:hypothetical protein